MGPHIPYAARCYYRTYLKYSQKIYFIPKHHPIMNFSWKQRSLAWEIILMSSPLGPSIRDAVLDSPGDKPAKSIHAAQGGWIVQGYGLVALVKRLDGYRGGIVSECHIIAHCDCSQVGSHSMCCDRRTAGSKHVGLIGTIRYTTNANIAGFDFTNSSLSSFWTRFQKDALFVLQNFDC